MPPDDNGWIEYRKLVIRGLENHEKGLDKVEERLSAIDTRIALLEQQMQRKAAVAGLMSGGAVSIIAAVIVWLIKGG